MLLKVTSKRQVTFPARVLDALGVGPGDHIELLEGPDGFFLQPRQIDFSKLGTLRDKISPGIPPVDIRKFRDDGYDPYSCGSSLNRPQTYSPDVSKPRVVPCPYIHMRRNTIWHIEGILGLPEMCDTMPSRDHGLAVGPLLGAARQRRRYAYP